MKRIFMMFAAMIMFVAVSAQVTPETVIVKPSALDNNYVSLTVGATTPLKINCHDLTVYPQVNIYAGHQFTPVWGIEFNGEMNLWDKFKTRDCFVASSYVGVAGTVNLTNLIGGYPGYARVCEVSPFVGVGWVHGYTRGSGDTNDFGTKMGVNVQFNLNQHWALNVRPTVLFNLTENSKSTYPAEYDIHHGRLGIEVGATYTFNHRFTQKEVVDWSAYQALNEEVNALRARKPETVVVKEVVTVVEQSTNIVAQVVSQPTNVGFTLNSDKIAYTQMAGILNVATAMKEDTNLKAVVKGYADARTGTPKYNMGLSERRAQAVKNALVEMGVDASRITVEAEGSCSQVYSENDWNRAAVIYVK